MSIFLSLSFSSLLPSSLHSLSPLPLFLLCLHVNSPSKMDSFHPAHCSVACRTSNCGIHRGWGFRLTVGCAGVSAGGEPMSADTLLPNHVLLSACSQNGRGLQGLPGREEPHQAALVHARVLPHQARAASAQVPAAAQGACVTHGPRE